MLFRIGDFSKLLKVTPKTLRFYEESGLIEPDKVDPLSGYRYYDSCQMPKIHKILALKDLGFSLRHIADVLADPRELEALSRIYRDKARKQVTMEKRRLKGLEALIESGGEGGMELIPVVKNIPGCFAASMQSKIDSIDDLFILYPRLGEEMARLNLHCGNPHYCFSIYRDSEYRDRGIDVELCEAVREGSPPGNSQIRVKAVPPLESAACLLHRGSYDDIGSSHRALLAWIEREGYAVCGQVRESYIDGIWNKDNEEQWLTEIQIPVIWHNN